MYWRRYFSFSVVEDPRMIEVALCRRMKWTYTDLMSQPKWFIDMLVGLLQEENRSGQKDK